MRGVQPKEDRAGSACRCGEVKPQTLHPSSHLRHQGNPALFQPPAVLGALAQQVAVFGPLHPSRSRLRDRLEAVALGCLHSWDADGALCWEIAEGGWT